LAVEEAVRQFVERMGLVCEKEGMARSAGRIFALLLVSARPFSLDELTEKLQASKAGVSTNCRMLEQFGMIERVSSLGDRRDFYQVRGDPWEHMMRVAQSRWRDMVKVLAEAQAAIPGAMAEGRERLGEAERFHTLMIREVDAMLEHWRAMKEGGSAAAPAGHAA
jgi:DNA-binding transcriptional regulator GbsR (MarR family)